MYRIENGEEVGSVRVAILRVLVLQVFHHFTVTTKLGVYVFDSQLIILRHSDKLAFGNRQQRFLALKDLAHEVAVDGRKGWHI